ncbi:MAG: multiheme c-type cytochrome [bacterium]|nr:multiheme c-type cytochrome [bacterium]
MFNVRHPLVLAFCLLILGCSGRNQSPPLVIWVTGGLQGQWIPQGEYRQVKSGGLLRTARALELYRQKGDLLVDLGRFRYPEGVVGETRALRVRANGFLKQLARMDYTALNVSGLDLSPSPEELAARAKELNLPLISSNLGITDTLFSAQEVVKLADGRSIRIYAFSGGINEFSNLKRNLIQVPTKASQPTFAILLTDATLEEIESICKKNPEIGLVLWQNEGDPTATEASGVLILGFGNRGTNLGRISLEWGTDNRPKLKSSDLIGWLDGKPYRHHPVRERLRSHWGFWRKKTILSAFLWTASEEISPQQEAERQLAQTQEGDRRLSDLEDLHKEAPKEYAGPQRCLDCHQLDHPRDLARLHQPRNPEAIVSYPVYERCLPCHSTGFDDPSGFLYPWERLELRWVSCEACHDAAFKHSLNGAPPYPRHPEEKICQTCHDTTQYPIDHPRKSG